MSCRTSHIALFFATILILSGCMDRSLPETPANAKSIVDDLAKAITEGDQAKVAELVSMEPALLNEPHPTGQQYPLHVAATVNNEALIKFLVEKGAHPFVQNDEGEFPADVARNAGASPEIVTLLMTEPQQ